MLKKIIKTSFFFILILVLNILLANIIASLFKKTHIYAYLFNTPWPSCVFTLSILIYFVMENTLRWLLKKRNHVLDTIFGNVFLVFRLAPAIESLAIIILSFAEIFITLNVNCGLILFFIGFVCFLHYIFSLKWIPPGTEKKFEYIYYITGALGLIIISGYEIDVNKYKDYVIKRYETSAQITDIELQYKILDKIYNLLFKEKRRLCVDNPLDINCQKIQKSIDESFTNFDTDVLQSSNVFDYLISNKFTRSIILSDPEIRNNLRILNAKNELIKSLFITIHEMLDLSFVKKYLVYIQESLLIIIGKIIIAIALAFKTVALTIELNKWHKLPRQTHNAHIVLDHRDSVI